MLGNALVYQGKQLMNLITVLRSGVQSYTLLFFIDYHVNDEELPSELSKASQPTYGLASATKENCLSRKCMGHGDTSRSDVQEISAIKRHLFDPCLPDHRVGIDPSCFHALLTFAEVCT